MTGARPPLGPSANATRTLGIIRIALLVGVLAFGAVVWFLRRSDEAPFAVDPRGLRLAGQAVWAAATLGTLGLFLAAARVSPERRATLSVIAWALGESTAIYGGLFWMLLGDPQWYLYGVACLVLTYLIFPIRGTR
ncbi:MAG TPA: hypothetical protein VFZ21_04065 [Gemmatimonadaceae bacterium]|jgi:hypothetical protein|nr:hypothetical protein [Gemmatimonadaceae bacterium]